MSDAQDQDAVVIVDKRTVEAWAEAKGMLPQFISVNGRSDLNPDYWKYAAARSKFISGELITDGEFEQAVSNSMTHIIR